MAKFLDDRDRGGDREPEPTWDPVWVLIAEGTVPPRQIVIE